ncbi:phosphate ABC transporter permease PstA [Micrococcus terreus]|uniref:phosphate ABC transporter permease PstA n=1 Tax=Micrococcus terreus TaxID=574650 RepID=UPI00301633BB
MPSTTRRDSSAPTTSRGLQQTGFFQGERAPAALVVLFVLWACLATAVLFLLVLLVTTFVDGQEMFSWHLITDYASSDPEQAGARAAILGSVWVIATTAVMTIPVGVAAAVYLEEFADHNKWWNRAIEVNVQNLAAVPSIIYGLLTLGVLTALGIVQRNIVIAGAIALSLLILPVIIVSTREAIRSVPNEIRQGSLALGATQWQTTWRQVLPSSVPGIATGSILSLSRAMGEAAPLLVLGALVFVTFDPTSIFDQFSTMPIQIFNWASRPQAEFHQLASATSILLLVLLLAMNAVAITIRNIYEKRW